jgi:acetyltransferase-like isoleucine patch superfamily enzyme
MAITPALNRLTFDDANEIRAVFSDLIGNKVDESFSLIPPFYTTDGENIRVGRNVFINQNCAMYDLGGIDIADDVMIWPNVSIITSGHPREKCSGGRRGQPVTMRVPPLRDDARIGTWARLTSVHPCSGMSAYRTVRSGLPIGYGIGEQRSHDWR